MVIVSRNGSAKRDAARPVNGRVNHMFYFLVLSLAGLLLAADIVAGGESNTTLPSQCLKFLALGDWGTPLVASTAISMGTYVKPGENATEKLLSCSAKVSSVLLLGDNFYDEGIKSPDDPLVKEIYYKNFGSAAFENTSFSVIVGNHDHRGSVRAQQELTDKDELRHWYLPRLFYSQTFEIGDLRVLLVFVDTWDLVGGEAEVWGPDQKIVDSQQLRWIKDVLRTEDVDYKVVAGHYPIRSARRDTPALVNELLPILLENKVDAYVFGHDHIAQHIHRDGLHYLGSGLGGRIYDGQLQPTLGLKYALKSSLGYMSFVFDAGQMMIRVHRVLGEQQAGEDEITYTATIPSRRSQVNTEVQDALLSADVKTSLAAKIRSSLLGQ